MATFSIECLAPLIISTLMHMVDTFTPDHNVQLPSILFYVVPEWDGEQKWTAPCFRLRHPQERRAQPPLVEVSLLSQLIATWTKSTSFFVELLVEFKHNAITLKKSVSP